YRIAGTIIGASGALLLVPPLVQSPPLLCLAMSAWVGLWLLLSLLDRTPRSYAPMLAGYTATIVGLSVVNMPEAIFDTMVARVEEISIGIVCGAVAHSIFFPRTVATELNEKIAAATRTCARWIAQTLLAPPDRARDVSASRQLSQLVTELYILNTHAAFDTSDVPRFGRHMQVLQNRLASLLPQLTGAQLAIDILRDSGELRPPLTSLVEETVRWTRGLTESPDILDVSQALPLHLHSYPAMDAQGEALRHDRSRLLEQVAATHILALVATLEDCRLLARSIRDQSVSLPSSLESEVRSAQRIPLHRDVGLAFLSAGAAMTGVIISSVLWIGGSWPEGAIAVQFAAIGCSLFATLDRPSGILGAALIGVLIALPFAALYQFAIFPLIDGYASLALVLTPVLLLLSFMQTIPKLAGAALILAITFSGGLALQESYQADFAAFMNTNLAEIVGLLIAIVINLVFRTIDPSWNALRISRNAWRALSRAADSGTTTPGWQMHMLDRLGQVAVRLEHSDTATQARSNVDVLRDLRVSASIAAINDAQAKLDPLLTPLFDAIRRSVGTLYRARARAREHREPSAASIERSLDMGIDELADQPSSEWRSKALAGLVTLRMDLLPCAAFHSSPRATT
ncbi:MAG: FUSC family protein, partial [Steroidobacteraceae bacterium]